MTEVSESFFGNVQKFDEKLRASVEQNPVFFITISLALLIIIFFWNVIHLLLQGFFFPALALIVIVLAFFVRVRAKYRLHSVKELVKRRNRLVDAIQISKQKYLHRQISEQDFNHFFKEKQRELIGVEALIAQASSKSRKISRRLESVQAKTRHFLKNLLEEKRLVLKEMDIAERSYLARKIDQQTYKEILQKKQGRLIELESEIKNLFKEEKARKVEVLLRKEKILKKKKARQKQTYVRKKQREIAEEIFEQEPKID